MSGELSLRDQRLQKLARLRELGADPYAVEKFVSTGTAAELVGEGFEAREESKEVVTFAGRLVSYRLMGKAGFAHLSDGDGRIQAYFRRDDLEAPGWEIYGLLDIGDHVGVEGYLFTTKTGERSIHVRRVTPLSKALHALPIGKEKDGETFSGLSDPELRFRHRHLDLIANKEAREALLNRARIVSAVRRYFDGLGYLEVETPLLQLEAGGAAARPFTTHYNAYDLDVKLRISLELYLKRIIAGDVPRVYEIGRVFRNEGLSSRHNPEFTLLEFYEAYVDLETMMERVEGCFRYVAEPLMQKAFADASKVSYSQWDQVSEQSTIMLDNTYFEPVGSAWEKLYNFDTASLYREVIRAGSTIQMRNVSVRIVSGDCDLYQDAELGPLLRVIDPVEVERENSQVTELPSGVYRVTLPLDPNRVSVAMMHGIFLAQFKEPWKRVDLLEEIETHSGVPRIVLSDIETAKAYLGVNPLTNPTNGKTIDPHEESNLGGLIEKLLEVFVEPTLQEPTFVVGYPIETSPLAKKDPNRPGFTRRFEGYVLGREICNAFSEINDPIDQRERFEQQMGERAKGDDEAHPMDEDFLFALESGMPPTGGCGIGLDRMAMLLTGASSIRDVLMFPMMRPQRDGAGDEIGPVG